MKTKTPTPIETIIAALTAQRDQAGKKASTLDARVVIVRRDLQNLELDHREALGHWKGLDEAIRTLNDKASTPTTNGTPRT